MAAKPKPKSLRILRWLVALASGAHLTAVAAVLYALEHCGETQWRFSPLLYLPPQGWLLPLLALTPLALLLCRWAILLHGLAVIFVLLGFMHFHSPQEELKDNQYEAGEVLTVVTANIGQRKVNTLQPFLDEMDADVIAFQENLYREKSFDRTYTGYGVQIVGEFTLASKLPIRNAALVPDLEFEGRPVAARFELEYRHKPIALYNVHMPTPRSYLYELRGRGFLVESVLGGGLFAGEQQQDYQYYWNSRFELARGLLAALEKEKLPVLLVGDFNTPDHGALYQLFAGRFTDSFARVGYGYGFTFPGSTHTPVAGYRPWLRLDYQFADEHWQAVESNVEPLTHAQHLAVEASYLLKE